ncbi:hypothetical protein BBI01_09165 [Chryseobacterium artocarpi]|uniref:Uncharacterized protein n=1 Tax=Chryseobacterium artocarpi TaxID=1414727 RepID=A0A1B8ZL29_9FLAO|nr:hypothetical protein [Chryseobacterium artocarpi]OCA72296.1 hypothetical protein BBI01_09165 [Chryseobacterium artocarpi]
MSKILFFFCFGFGFLASAQEKKQDSGVYEYKRRIFYPYDCSCLGKVIYKELSVFLVDCGPT